MKTVECIIELGTGNTVRQANNKEEYVRESVKKYKDTWVYLLKIKLEKI